MSLRAAWGAQSVEYLSLDFGWGYDLEGMGSSPMGSKLSGESAWDSLPPTPPPVHSCTLSLANK